MTCVDDEYFYTVVLLLLKLCQLNSAVKLLLTAEVNSFCIENQSHTKNV